jgi:hypothetical protein
MSSERRTPDLSEQDVNRLLRSYLREEWHEDANRVASMVLDELDETPQRRSGGTAWRSLIMNNNIVRVGLMAAAVVVLAIIAINVVPGITPPGGEVSPSATAEPTVPETASSPPASPPPLTQSFTSTLHGISMSFPEGWTAQAATEPWTASTFPLNFPVPQVDWLYDPTLTSDLFLAIASQPIGDFTPEGWVAEQMASEEGCGTATEPITVDAASGLGCESHAVVTAGGRGYWIQLYTGDGAPLTYDQTWFEEVLATVQLHPEDAVD